VKLPDVNVLLYAYDREAPQHDACRAWLEAAFNSEELVALPWLTLLAFLRITTNSKAYKRPLQNTEACDIVSAWIARPNVRVIEAGERFWEVLRAQIVEAQVSGPLVSDAALAALAIEHGAAMVSVDRDFRRFRGLRLIDPTEAAN
jgi:toxin-antitoxin system PIN domain toxin